MTNTNENQTVRSGSIANAVGNKTYPDLVLTRYPDTFDERSGSKNNPNLNRWTNLKDYNMAEHVNALQDAIMAIQRMLGEKAHMPAKPVDKDGNPVTDPNELLNISQSSTVKDRIDAMETYDWYADFDKRYGGPTWSFDKKATVNPTIQQHRHVGSKTGVPGMPEQISLTEEVRGQLPKANINLTASNGLTGADIYVGPTATQKISEALGDMISEKTGGTIAQGAQLTVNGRFNSRTRREYDSSNAQSSGNTKVQDTNTLLKTAMQSSGTAASNFLNETLTNMHYGRYVAIVRIASNNLSSSNVAEIRAVDTNTNSVLKSVVLKGSDFEASNKYKTFFLVFDHNGSTQLNIRKLSTSSSVQVRFDYAIIEPVHPAVFDR